MFLLQTNTHQSVIAISLPILIFKGLATLHLVLLIHFLHLPLPVPFLPLPLLLRLRLPLQIFLILLGKPGRAVQLLKCLGIVALETGLLADVGEVPPQFHLTGFFPKGVLFGTKKVHNYNAGGGGQRVQKICIFEKECYATALAYYYTSDQSILISFMSSSTHPTPRQLAADQRRQARKDIYALNRTFRQLAEATAAQNFKVVRESAETDPAYRTLIETLKRKTYGRNEILDLVGLLAGEDLLQVYRGVVGLSAFGKEVFTRESEEEFLGSGVIPKLVQLALWRDHPFLQLRSLQILRHLAKTITPDNLRAFCNLTTIPFSLFVDAIHFSSPNFNQVIYLLQALNERGRFIDPCDANIHLLDKINDVVDLVSKGFSKWIPKLNLTLRLMGEINVQFWNTRRRFANKYYQIRAKILSIYRKEKIGSEVCLQIRHTYNKEKIKAIFSAINEHPHEVPAVANYVQELIDAAFEINFSDNSSTFCIFMNTIIGCKQTKTVLPRLQLLERVEAILLKQSTQKKSTSSNHKSEECINVASCILGSADDDLLQAILNRKQLFQLLSGLYTCWDKKVICELNRIVRFMVTHSFKTGVMQVLQQHCFIEKYFKNCHRFNQMTVKGALKYLMWALMDLKRKNIDHYQLIRSEVVTDENYEIINKVRSTTYLSGMKEIFDFYSAMREEGKPTTQQTIPPQIDIEESSNHTFRNNSISEPRLAENPFIEAIEVSDGPQEEDDEYQYAMPYTQMVIDVDGVIILDE